MTYCFVLGPDTSERKKLLDFFATALGTHHEAGAEKKETSRWFFRGVRAGKVFLLNGTRKVWKLSHFANLEKLRLFINFVTFQDSNYLFRCDIMKVPTKTPATDKIIAPKKYFHFRKWTFLKKMEHIWYSTSVCCQNEHQFQIFSINAECSSRKIITPPSQAGGKAGGLICIYEAQLEIDYISLQLKESQKAGVGIAIKMQSASPREGN